MKLSNLAYLVELDEGWNKMFTAQAQLEDKQRRANRKHIMHRCKGWTCVGPVCSLAVRPLSHPQRSETLEKKDLLGLSRTKSSQPLG